VITLPERDAEGYVIPHNHPDINDNHEVIRRINNLWVKDGRISSMAYKASSGKNGGMSIDLKQLIENDGRNAIEFVQTTTPRLAGAVIFKVCDLRNLGFLVGYDPINGPELEPNPYHGEVWGNFSKGQVNNLRSKAKWLLPISGVNVA
jgi:hypothetical protein